MEREDKLQSAIQLCINVGAIEECKVHLDEYSDSMEYSDPEELTQEILRQNPEALSNFDNQKEMVGFIQSALHSVGYECGYCDKNNGS